ncbi:MAG: tripartite tricarboxylate transporter substrate binding protein [Betaproteobacteria bacterium]|nr:tripartite tricarboxylate transporter substrate binding protein [Betaproteobacteria bacterium]
MTNKTASSILLTLIACAGASMCGPALAQVYPAKPVRIIVGVPPGGFTDAVARNLAQKLIEATGQQFLVENRTGASGLIAIDAALKSPADGYTLLVSTNAEMAVNPHVLAKIPYDPFRDFTPIVPVAIAGLVIAANGGAGLNSLQELVTAARARPGFYSYATAGNGTVNHLAGEWFASVAAIKMVHVPYKGGGPAAQDVVGGQIPLGVLAVSAAIPHLRTGRVKVLAVTAAKRLSFAPELPTVAESGYPGFEVSLWAAFFGQPGIPKEVVARINTEVNRALTLPDVRERLHTIGAEALGGTAEDVSTLIRNDHARYGRVARDNNIRAD